MKTKFFDSKMSSFDRVEFVRYGNLPEGCRKIKRTKKVFYNPMALPPNSPITRYMITNNLEHLETAQLPVYIGTKREFRFVRHGCRLEVSVKQEHGWHWIRPWEKMKVLPSKLISRIEKFFTLS